MITKRWASPAAALASRPKPCDRPHLNRRRLLDLKQDEPLVLEDTVEVVNLQGKRGHAERSWVKNSAFTRGTTST